MVENFACNFLLSLEALASSPLPLLISSQTGLSKSKTKLILKRKWLLSGFLMPFPMFFLSSSSLQFSLSSFRNLFVCFKLDFYFWLLHRWCLELFLALVLACFGLLLLCFFGFLLCILIFFLIWLVIRFLLCALLSFLIVFPSAFLSLGFSRSFN